MWNQDFMNRVYFVFGYNSGSDNQKYAVINIELSLLPNLVRHVTSLDYTIVLGDRKIIDYNQTTDLKWVHTIMLLCTFENEKSLINNLNKCKR